MGIIMLIGFITIGFFIFPIGITLCSIIGLCYGITGKDKLFTRWSFIGLSVGIIFFNLHLLRYTRNVKNYSPI